MDPQPVYFPLLAICTIECNTMLVPLHQFSLREHRPSCTRRRPRNPRSLAGDRWMRSSPTSDHLIFPIGMFPACSRPCAPSPPSSPRMRTDAAPAPLTADDVLRSSSAHHRLLPPRPRRAAMTAAAHHPVRRLGCSSLVRVRL